VIGSVAFPAFLLGHEPSKEILCISYGQDLADDFSRSCLNLMRTPFYQAVFKTRLDQSRQAVEEFKTTAGGTRRATSLAGGITGRGADIIIIDDPIKADDSQSDARRKSANDSFYQSVYSRLNNKTTSAIVIIMQRLHAEDFVAYVQEQAAWDVIAFPALAETDEGYNVSTPYGRRRIVRKAGEALHHARESAESLRDLRSKNEYVFTAQYQQDPQPAGGLIVKREWLHRFDLDNPPPFETKIQSWDTANKATELSDFSVCTTWGLNNGRLYLLHVLQKKMEFPELKHTVRDHAKFHSADLVLVEDNASGTQLIQELRSENFSLVQASSTKDGDKVMRLRVQTAKIEGGFARFPENAPWLDAYLLELLSFPYAKHDDQVDSTVHALAWLTDQANVPGAGLLEFYRREAAKIADADGTENVGDLVKIRALTAGQIHTKNGKIINCDANEIVLVDRETAGSVCRGMNFQWVES
jgi:predicted phage terminase large subunit-like protein